MRRNLFPFFSFFAPPGTFLAPMLKLVSLAAVKFVAPWVLLFQRRSAAPCMPSRSALQSLAGNGSAALPPWKASGFLEVPLGNPTCLSERRLDSFCREKALCPSCGYALFFCWPFTLFVLLRVSKQRLCSPLTAVFTELLRFLDERRQSIVEVLPWIDISAPHPFQI